MTPPDLTSFSFTPIQINTLYFPATVNVTISATDDLSGAKDFYVLFQSPSGEQNQGNWATCTPVSTACTTTTDVIFPQYSEAGIWTIRSVYALDAIGNFRYYYTADLGANGLPTQLLNTDLDTPESVYINAGALPAVTKGKWREVKLQAFVQNIGNLRASNVQVGFAYSTDGGLTFMDIGVSRAGNLAPGAAGVAEQTWKTTPAEFLIRVTLDPSNRIAEYTKTNSLYQFALIVQ